MTTLLAPEPTRVAPALPVELLHARPELADLPSVGVVLVAAASESA